MTQKKRIFIIHGWDGSPHSCWLPWLKNELEKKGFDVIIPAMPHPENPTIKDWVSHLSNKVGKPDKNTYFVGHSIGCQTILRYIDQIEKPIGGIVCVAPWFTLPHLRTDEEKKIAQPWLETSLDYKNIKRRANKIIAIFSDDDPVVDLGDKNFFENRLSAKTVVEHNKGHFSDDAGIKELPSSLKAVLEVAGENKNL